MNQPTRSRLFTSYRLLLALALSAAPFLATFAQETDKASDEKKEASRDLESNEKEAKSPSPSLNPPSSPSTSSLSAVDEDLYQKIRKFHDAMPADLGSIKGDEADKLALETEKAVVNCARFESASLPKSLKVSEVTYMHAKLLYLLSERQRYKWMLELKEKGAPNLSAQILTLTKGYLGEVSRLAKAAYESLPKDSPFHPRALQLLGQASADGQDPQKARQAYQKLIETYPTYEEIDKIRLALARACLDMEDYSAGIDVASHALKEHYKSDQYPYFVELLWKLYHSSGNLDGMETVTRMVDTAYPLKLTNTNLARTERDNFERFIGFNGFRKGYTLFAMGDFAGAKSAFTTHIAELDATEAGLEKKGQQLKPELKIYRQRSRDNMTFLDNLAGLPPTLDFDLGGAWGTRKKVTLAESRGKVVAVIFRGIGDERSASFIGPVSQFCMRQPGMEMVVLSYMRGGENVEKQLETLREELLKLGYEGAAGFDPDPDGKKLFRAYQANVGSATFLVVNRRGELVWFMQDPRGVDTRFAEAILQRWSSR